MPELSAAAIRAHTEEIVGIGNRFAGTPGEQRCRDFLLTEFGEIGLSNVHAEEFPFLAYEPVSSGCWSVGTAESLGLQSEGLQFSASATAEGAAVFLGGGSMEEIEALEQRGVGLAGKVAVVRTFMIPAIAADLIERGIVAIVNIGEAPDGLIQSFVATFYPPPVAAPWNAKLLPIPGVTIEAQAGQRLIELIAKSDIVLRVVHEAAYVEKSSANVVGEIAGRDGSGESVVIGAHYDTQLRGAGAADNATGVAALLGIATALRGTAPNRTVTVVAFGVEELACWGAIDFVRQRQAGIDAIVGMVNLDALGLPAEGTRTLVGDPAISAFAHESAALAGWEPEAFLNTNDLPFADYIPFVHAGVPACWLWRFPPQHPYYHSSGDTLEHVDFHHVDDVAKASAFLVYRLACQENPGIKRSTFLRYGEE